jgi:outer membrane protein OmpA-like peptidoglycan-associated protein
MAEDWLIDVRKYAANADENVVQSVIRYCGIALQSRDGQLVAMSDKKERDTVRENYLKKKLGLTNTDADLDAAILSVGERMKADRTKNRVTVYYLLAEHFGAFNIFGGVAGGVAGAAVGVAGLAAAAVGIGGADKSDDAPKATAAAVPLAAAALGAAAVGTVAAAVPTPDPVPTPKVATPAYAAANYDDGAAGGGFGWLKWLLLAALLAAILFFALRSCGKADDMAASVPVAPAAGVTAPVTPAGDAEAVATTEPAAVPQGSGVVAGERNGKPMLTVYFETAKTNLPTDFDKVAAVIKDYTAKNPDAKLAVSGFNSATGSAAGNARLSKGRAENVGAALQKLGVPAGAVALVKPAESTQGAGEDANARRVEVTVQ